MTRIVSLGPDGFSVSDDVDGVLGRFLGNVVLGVHSADIGRMFAPDGEGFWLPSLGGAQRIEERDELPQPHDLDPTIDPTQQELWCVERDIPMRKRVMIMLGGDELRALLADAQRLAAAGAR